MLQYALDLEDIPSLTIDRLVRLMFSMRAAHKARGRLTGHPHPALMPLVAEVGAACECPPHLMGDRVVAALHRTPPITVLMSPDQCEASAHCYTRRIIYGDPA